MRNKQMTKARAAKAAKRTRMEQLVNDALLEASNLRQDAHQLRSQLTARELEVDRVKQLNKQMAKLLLIYMVNEQKMNEALAEVIVP